MEPVTSALDSKPTGELYCPSCEKQFHAGERCPTDGTRLVKLVAQLDPFIGRELDGRYTILEKLGQGGMGAVYRGSQHSVGRDCAIKVISAHLVSDAEVIKRFLREAKLASRLSHPNAVSVLDFGQTDDGVFYLAMELVTGRTLDQVYKAEGKFRPERVARIGAQVCDALEGAHALQIVHRDLKPSNIMLLDRGRDLLKVLDFGLAKSLAPDQTSTTMTDAGALLGTPAFMPPELANGRPCDGRADLYSLGCVLYLLGSGRLPFLSTSAHELVSMHGSTEKAPPMMGVPNSLAMVVDRLLEKDPDARYQSAAEAREALEAAVDNWRYTPAAGVPVARSRDTDPSVGPFPKTSADLVNDDTLPPSPSPPPSQRRALTPTQMDAIASSATLAVAPSSASHIETKRSRTRWYVAAAAVIALGGGVLALTHHTDDAPPKPPAIAPAPAAVVTPAPPSTPPPPPVVTPVEPPPVQPVVKPHEVRHVKKPTKPVTHPTKPTEPPASGSNNPAKLPF
jgi:serine/threonine-protein kinase